MNSSLNSLLFQALIASWYVSVVVVDSFTITLRPTTVYNNHHYNPRSETPSSSSVLFNTKQLQSILVLNSASLEEAESLLSYTTTRKKSTKTTKEEEQHQPTKEPIRRVYETWNWTYTKTATGMQTPPTYKINYRVEGYDKDSKMTKTKASKRRAPPILLVHGFGANVNHFRYQYDDLVQAGYCVYAIDLLGFGASDKPLNAADIGFSIELFTQQLIDFIQYIDSKEGYSSSSDTAWTLAGNSIGGLCCLCVAAQIEKQKQLEHQPSISRFCKIRISSIVLFNTSGGMTGFRYDDVPIFLRPILAFFQYVILGPYIGGYFFRNFRSRENIEQILKESGVYGDRTNVDDALLEILLAPADDVGAEQVFLAVFGGPAGPTAESILPNVKIPVLALWGTNDPWTPIDGGLHPGNILPPFHGTNDFTLVPLEGAGHCPHDECPAIVNEKMIAFMKDIALTRAKATKNDATLDR